MFRVRFEVAVGFAVFLFSAFCSLPCLSAATYYVRQGAAGNCSTATTDGSSSALGAINSGFACLTAGDTLLVHGGIYDEVLNSSYFNNSGVSWANKIRIAASSGEIPWVRSTDPSAGIAVSCIDTRPLAYIEFDGINVDASRMPSAFGLIKVDVTPTGECHHIRWMNSEWILGHATTGFLSSGDAIAQGGNEIIKNKIHGQLERTDGRSLPGAMFYIGTSNNIIDGNEIWDNHGGGGQLYSDYGRPVNNNIIRNNYWHDMLLSQASDDRRRINAFVIYGGNHIGNQFYNNVMARIGVGGAGDYGLAVGGGASNTKVWNNTFYGINGIAVDLDSEHDSSTTGEFINNISYGSSVDFARGSTGWTISNTMTNGTNPVFVNAGASDFHLQSNSPAIDTGAPIAGVTTDRAGIARSQGNGYDIGAYEYVGSTSYSCPGGTLCDGSSVTGTPNQIVCGADLKNWQCTPSTIWNSLETPCTCGSFSACDVNQTGGSPNVADVQLAVNQVLGTCVLFGQPGTADINQDGKCTIVDVQRVVNAVLGGQCVSL